MNRKPWPILALALFQWLSPLGDWLVSSLASHLSPIHYLQFMISQQGVSGYFLHSWAPGLLAGVAVYRVKPWSYPVFLGCILYGSYLSAISGRRSFGSDPHVWFAHAGSVAFWVLPLLMNLFVGAWFLLPRVRRPFFHRSLRWWEAASRFSLSLPARVFPVLDGKRGSAAEIRNLARGGALLEFRSPSSLQKGDRILLGFRAVLSQALGPSSETDAWVFSESRVVHRATDARQVGVEFCGMSPRYQKSLLKLLRAARELNVPQIREETGFFADLKYWVNRFYGAQDQNASVAALSSEKPRRLANVTRLEDAKRRAA